MDCLLNCGSEVDIEIFIVDLSSPPPEELNCSLPKLFPNIVAQKLTLKKTFHHHRHHLINQDLNEKNGICLSLRKTFCGYFFRSLRKEPKQCEYIHMYGTTLLKFNSFLC